MILEPFVSCRAGIAGVPIGGGGWIRTHVGVRQRIYSPSPLATRAPLPSPPGWDDATTAANHADQRRYVEFRVTPNPWTNADDPRPATLKGPAEPESLFQVW